MVRKTHPADMHLFSSAMKKLEEVTSTTFVSDVSFSREVCRRIQKKGFTKLEEDGLWYKEVIGLGPQVLGTKSG